MIKIIMHGYNGKMGKVICDLVEKDKNCEIVAGIDPRPTNAKFPTFINIDECNMEADVIIDFSTATALSGLLKYVSSSKIPTVICTTGLDEKILAQINEVSSHVAIFKSANMSLGVNLLANVLKRVSSILYENSFDIEIIEKHHNQKIDAPSGTAILLADAINDSMSNQFKYVYDRSTTREKRDPKEIGIASIRAGNIVGEHSIIFSGKDETVELSHFAYSKEIFAVGAIKAAKFLVKKSPGKYDMQSIMNEL